MAISISPSMLDTYRNAVAGQYVQNGDQLEQEIVGERVTTEAMSRGTAVHLLIENGPRAYVDPKAKMLRVPEPELGVTWEFSYEVGTAVKNILDGCKGITHEVKDLLALNVDGETVYMSLRVDGLWGSIVKEFKTKGSAPSYMAYFDSIQWRCYLMAFADCEAVQYHVLHLGASNNLLGAYQYEMRRYDGLESDVYNSLRGFIEWAKTRPNVWGHLQKRGERYVQQDATS